MTEKAPKRMFTDKNPIHHLTFPGSVRSLARGRSLRRGPSWSLPALFLVLAAGPCHAGGSGFPLPLAVGGSSMAVASLSATNLDGAPIDLAARPGWRVVYFWSGACPCVTACERYSFVPLAKKYKGKVSFFAVASCGYDLHQTRPKLRQTIAARHLPFPVLLDPSHKVAQALGAKVTPQAFLLDPEGRVVFSGMPDDSRRYLDETGKAGVSRGYLARALSQALAGKPITQPQVKDAGCIIAW